MDEEAYLNPTLTHDEDAILKSPQGSTSSKSPEIPPSTSDKAQTPHKKVVLKRKLLTSISISDEPSSDAIENDSVSPKVVKLDESEHSENGADTSNGNSVADASVVKLSQLTMKERLELRAKKFGAAPSADALKMARAERFGLAASTTPSTASTVAPASAAQPSKVTPAVSSSAITKSPAADVDILKKRAERFGGSVSGVMVTIENKEKLLKRQERFGASAATATATATAIATSTVPAVASTTQVKAPVNDEYAEKAKLRLERFKTSA